MVHADFAEGSKEENHKFSKSATNWLSNEGAWMGVAVGSNCWMVSLTSSFFIFF